LAHILSGAGFWRLTFWAHFLLAGALFWGEILSSVCAKICDICGVRRTSFRHFVANVAANSFANNSVAEKSSSSK